MRAHKAEPRALTTDAEEPATDVELEIFVLPVMTGAVLGRRAVKAEDAL